MKHIFSIFMLLSASLLINMEAEGLYEYTTQNDGTITIIGYKGPYDVRELVVPKTIEGYTVSAVKKLISKDVTEPKSIEFVYLPPSISTPSNNYLLRDLLSLKCGVIENNTELNSYPFQFTTFSTSLSCIFTFGASVRSEESIIGSYYPNALFHLGHVTIEYNDASKELIQVYNWGNTIDEKVTMDKTRYEYLIWALETHLASLSSNISVITLIDFSHLTKICTVSKVQSGVKFNFGDDYNPASALSSGAQVILPNDITYTNTPTPYTITDLQDFTYPTTAQTITDYSRSNTQQWNSVCLPFDIIESDFPVGTHIYTLNTSTSTAEEIHLSRCTGTVSAGTPCVIYSESPNWDLSFETEPRTVRTDVSPQTQQSVYWQLCGSFTTTNIGQNHYKLNDEGNAFSVTTSNGKIHPFRCYLQYVGQGSVPTRVRLLIDEN